MKKLLLFSCVLLFVSSLFSAGVAEYNEEIGIDTNSHQTVVGQRTTRDIPEGGLLLIPESTNKRVMAFDPITGDLYDADFIPADEVNLSTPIQAALHPDGNSILVSDQIEDGILQYDLEGNFMGWFAPAGGVNNAILDNVRGWCIKADGNILVTVGSGSNEDAIAEFDATGNSVGNFIAPNSALMDGPFDVIYRDVQDDYLVTGLTSDAVHQYDNAGVYIGDLATGINFPEQVSETPSGNLLVAGFSPPSGIYEYTSDGTYVGYYNLYTGLRGVYELGNGNILLTNGSGVYEIDRNNTLVSTKISGVSGRFISFVEGDETGTVLGNVTDTDTGLAIEGADVVMDPYSTVTNASGDYSFEDVTLGTYELVCSYEGYEDFTESDITVVTDDVITIDISLQHLYNPPESLTYQFIETDVILEWIAPVGQGLTGYSVYRDGEVISNVTELTFTDVSVPTGTYTYYVTAVYGSYESIPSNEVVIDVVGSDPDLLQTVTNLVGNYPNPFNPTTSISFDIAEGAIGILSVYTIKGQLIESHLFNSGHHDHVWNAQNQSSGIYFYKLETEGSSQIRKMLLLK